MRRQVLLVASGALVVLLASGVAFAATAAFAPAKNYHTGNAPRAVAPGDLDADGDSDVAIANGAADKVSVLIMRPDGSFRAPRAYAAGDGPADVTRADLDGDGDQDLAVANVGDDTVSVLRNRGDGNFTAQRKYATGTNRPGSIESGDLDGDGDLDLVSANAGGYKASRPNSPVLGTVSVFKNRGDGTFAAARNYVAGEDFEPSGLDRSDLDDDGDQDLAVSLEYTRNGEGGLAVLLNDGTGAFGGPQRYDYPWWSSDVVANDFDGDGDNDLAVSDAEDSTVTVYRGDGDGAFAYQDSYPIGEGARGPYGLTEADFDRDGDLDVATANSNVINGGADNVSVLENAGDGTLVNPRVLDAGVTPLYITRARMNADLKPDLVVANAGSDNVSVLRNVTP